MISIHCFLIDTLILLRIDSRLNDQISMVLRAKIHYQLAVCPCSTKKKHIFHFFKFGEWRQVLCEKKKIHFFVCVINKNYFPISWLIQSYLLCHPINNNLIDQRRRRRRRFFQAENVVVCFSLRRSIFKRLSGFFFIERIDKNPFFVWTNERRYINMMYVMMRRPFHSFWNCTEPICSLNHMLL